MYIYRLYLKVHSFLIIYLIIYTTGLETELNVWYLDDGTLRNLPEKVFAVVTKLVNDLRGVGLELNSRKCELTTINHTKEEEIQMFERFKEMLHERKIMPTAKSFLLGAPPPPSEKRISVAVREKVENLELLVFNMKIIEKHQAFILLKNCFALPKLQYIFRISPAYSHMEDLERFDDALVAVLAAVTNIRFGEKSLAPVALPVCL